VTPLAGEFLGYVREVVEVRTGIVIVEYEVFGRRMPIEHIPGELAKVVALSREDRGSRSVSLSASESPR
jgi:hypothetical protein